MTISKKDVVGLYNEMVQTHADAKSRMSVLENRLAQIITDWDAVPPPPPPQPAPLLRKAIHKYENRTPVPAGYDLYDLQRGWTGSPPAGAEVYFLATPVRSMADPNGWRQFMPPSKVPDTWCAHLDTTTLVTRRINGGDTLVNFGHAQWRVAAAASIIKQCKELGVRGVYHDEVDWVNEFAWPILMNRKCIEFPTENSWRDAYLGWIDFLSTELYRAGLKLWINLGANYSTADPWQAALLRLVNGVNIEFWMGREGVNQAPNSAGESWVSSVKFLHEAEYIFGVEVNVHCSSMDQEVIDYAFCSWLAGTSFYGSFAASLDYGGTNGQPTPALYAKALKLGRPVESVSYFNDHYSRQFQNGRLIVNPNNYSLAGEPALSGRIVLS